MSILVTVASHKHVASGLTTAGVSPLTIAQMLGHSSTQIVPRYAQVLDQNHLDAMKKLEALRSAANSGADEGNEPKLEPDARSRVTQ